MGRRESYILIFSGEEKKETYIARNLLVPWRNIFSNHVRIHVIYLRRPYYYSDVENVFEEFVSGLEVGKDT